MIRRTGYEVVESLCENPILRERMNKEYLGPRRDHLCLTAAFSATVILISGFANQVINQDFGKGCLYGFFADIGMMAMGYGYLRYRSWVHYTRKLSEVEQQVVAKKILTLTAQLAREGSQGIEIGSEVQRAIANRMHVLGLNIQSAELPTAEISQSLLS